MAAAFVPKSLDRFEVVARMSDRGLGECFHCLDPKRANGPVMVKLLRAAGPEMPAALAELLTRSQRVRHENILRIFDAGVWNQRPFVVYEYFEGSSMGDGLDRARADETLLPLDLLRAAFDGVVAALAFAHDKEKVPKPVLHLGISPACVIMRRLPDKNIKVKVLDFGLAQWADADPLAPARSARALLGASPEAYRGEGSPRSDVFSLGVLLREILSVPPDLGNTLTAAGRDRQRDDVPEAVWAVLQRATLADPAGRHASVVAFDEALREAWTQPLPARKTKPAKCEDDAPRPEPPRLTDPVPVRRIDPPTPPPVYTLPTLPEVPREEAPPAVAAIGSSAASMDSTIMLENVAARPPPSPWDLGALRDERAEAEESAASGWFSSGAAVSGNETFVVENPAPPEAPEEIDDTIRRPQHELRLARHAARSDAHTAKPVEDDEATMIQAPRPRGEPRSGSASGAYAQGARAVRTFEPRPPVAPVAEVSHVTELAVPPMVWHGRDEQRAPSPAPPAQPWWNTAPWWVWVIVIVVATMVACAAIWWWTARPAPGG